MADHVLALDLSLRSTGAATIDTTGRVDHWVKKTDRAVTDHDLAEQIREITLWCRDLIKTTTRLVVVEGPSLASTFGQPHERAGLWWAVRRVLARVETPSGAPLPIGRVVPMTLKHRITGSGKASKADMRAAVDALYPKQGLRLIGDDEADAVGLAVLGVIKLATVYGREVWKGPWLDARSLAIDTGCAWEHLPERESVRA